jgi:hypothetical protein
MYYSYLGDKGKFVHALILHLYALKLSSLLNHCEEVTGGWRKLETT